MNPTPHQKACMKAEFNFLSKNLHRDTVMSDSVSRHLLSKRLPGEYSGSEDWYSASCSIGGVVLMHRF